MEFLVGEIAKFNIPESTVSELLNEVYVGEKYVKTEVAKEMFEYNEIKKRGIVICAVEKQSFSLAGVVIFVSYESPASKLAKENESEMHLLCVNKKYRNKGIGKMLINSVIDIAIKNGNTKIILWTQKAMIAAQNLYEKAEFTHINNIIKNKREFLVYEKQLKA